MTAASDDSGLDAPRGRLWDVALSFAGAQRDYVEQVAQALQARDVRCFYDADEQVELWGKHLAEELPLIYGERAAVVVVFVSAEYAARDWTRVERRAALARAVRERREYVLPARFDDAELPGLLADTSYVDLRAKTPQQFAAIIVGKLASLGIIRSGDPAVVKGPGPNLIAGEGAAELPAAPDLVGRDSEVAALAGAWLANPPQPVAVLGAPGIGKSAICLAALHDQQVRERFGQRRWFVRCDGAASAAALLYGLAGELDVIEHGVPGTLLRRITTVLGERPAVVVLDNFETPWTADPLQVEALLRTLNTIPAVALTVSARGAARPAGLHWSDSAMLRPLLLADARRLFLAVAGPGFASDPQLDELLMRLDGVPLAVQLLGYAAQGQPLAEVAMRWQAERTGMLQRMGGATRELSVPLSVETSVTSRLMTAPALRLLALMGVLPDGIDREDLAVLLPDHGLGAAFTLRQLGLAFDEGPRLRMLAPIREHAAAAHPPDPSDMDRAIGHYVRMASDIGYQVGSGQGALAVARLQAETGNVTATVERAAAERRTKELADALYGLADYWRFTGFIQPALARTAQEAISTYGTARQQAQTWFALGVLAQTRSDLDDAQSWYERALPLYEQVAEMLGEANCIVGLGDIALARSDLDGAQARYEQALPLYEQAANILGEAICARSLGDIALARSDLDGAQARYEQALPLYEQAVDVLGEANCNAGLGNIALARLDFDGAQARYEQALPLYEESADVAGEAGCIKGLGDVALARSDLDNAQARYEQALPLSEQAADVEGEAGSMVGLGDVALARSDLDNAHARYERALALYQVIPAPFSIGWTRVRLARIAPSGDIRTLHWTATCQAWASIGRDDLIESLKTEFQ